MRDGKIIVLANGCFDICHAGHIAHLKACKALGDELWVSVTDDAHVFKGPGRPIFPHEHRMAVVRAIRYVDKVIGVSGLIEAIDFVKPDIVVKGADYSEGLADAHMKYCKSKGIEVRYTSTEKLSASDFLNESRRRQAS